jgi:hydroxyacyl-ACP dehydratase HTD2-like protein with hotdog domain
MTAVGDAIPQLVRTPSSVQLFAFSAATWNSHRIHYDAEFARSEGYSDILVQSHLHACFLLQAVHGVWGPDLRVERFGWQNRAPAVPGDELTVSGRVAQIDGDRIELVLEERNQRGELCVKGWATVVVA